MESKLIKLAIIEEKKGELKQQHEKVVKKEEDVRAWADLPIDLLDLIFSDTFERDCIRFRLTCKSWQSVTIPIRRSIPLPIQSEWSQQFPWLMTFSEKSSLGIFNFLHPISNETYLMEIPELAGSTFRCYKYGWLLMSIGKHSLFFFHLFTRSIINLPHLDYAIEFVSMSFTAPPTSPDCKVFGHEPSFKNAVSICMCSRGEDFWDDQRIDTKLRFKTSFCTPVFYKDVFYHLDVNGRLGVFDSEESDDGKLNWNDLPNPKPRNVAAEKFSDGQNYIAQCDGEFVSVFVGHIGDPVHVFKLDWSEMEWVAVESIGNKTMFINESGTLLIPAKSKTTEDRIYFPRFKIQDGGDCYSSKFDLSVEDTGFEVVFYSLRTQRYHVFGRDFSSRNWIDTEGVRTSAWIELDVNIQGIENEQQLVWFDPFQDDGDENDADDGDENDADDREE